MRGKGFVEKKMVDVMNRGLLSCFISLVNYFGWWLNLYSIVFSSLVVSLYFPSYLCSSFLFPSILVSLVSKQVLSSHGLLSSSHIKCWITSCSWKSCSWHWGGRIKETSVTTSILECCEVVRHNESSRNIEDEALSNKDKNINHFHKDLS